MFRPTLVIFRCLQNCCWNCCTSAVSSVRVYPRLCAHVLWCVYTPMVVGNSACCVVCSCYPYTLKIKAAGSSETLVTIYQFTRRHIPENGNLYSHSYEKLKYLNVKLPPINGKRNTKTKLYSKKSALGCCFISCNFHLFFLLRINTHVINGKELSPIVDKIHA
jgi:hypothetical protein